MDVDEGVTEGWVVFGASYFGASWMGWALGWGLEVVWDFLDWVWGFRLDVKGRDTPAREREIGLAGWAEEPTPRQGLVIRWLMFYLE